MERETLNHPFAPVWDAKCKVLVLGTFPSVKSRENAFYYGHPQNRFWRMLGRVFGEETPESVPEKRDFLLRHHIALWDVIQGCDIAGSADSSIRNAVPNDLPGLLAKCPVRRILLNGGTAGKVYGKYWKNLAMEAVVLPSTSPANAAWSLDALAAAWGKALKEE